MTEPVEYLFKVYEQSFNNALLLFTFAHALKKDKDFSEIIEEIRQEIKKAVGLKLKESGQLQNVISFFAPDKIENTVRETEKLFNQYIDTIKKAVKEFRNENI